MRDRDVMNLLDQLELYVLEKGEERVSQGEFWLFVFRSMTSGELITKSLRKHLEYKLESLGVRVSRGNGHT